jgi:hypothetical protein
MPFDTMPPITALLHTKNDALRLGRCLETLYPCDRILIVDHGSRDRTMRIARQYGADVVVAKSGISAQQYAQSAGAWILALDPRESLTEGLAASLFELEESWKAARNASVADRPFSVLLREETSSGWVEHPTPQTRLVPQAWRHWNGRFPAPEPSAVPLQGELLRFAFP